MSEVVLFRIFFFVLGLFLVWCGIYGIGRTHQCNQKITGIFIGTNRYYGGKGQDGFAPVVRYSVNGQKYEKQTFQSFSKKYIQMNFAIGQECDIWINEKKPKCFIVSRKIQATYFVMVCIGIFIWLLVIFAK